MRGALAPTARIRAPAAVTRPPQPKARPTSRPKESTPPPPPRARPRLPSLAHLEPAAHRLAFRSLPYAAPPHLIAPAPGQYTHHAQPYFSLRCFPSRPRSPSSSPSSSGTDSLSNSSRRTRASAKDSVYPVPFLRGRTRFLHPNQDKHISDEDDHDAFLSSPTALRASLARTSRSHQPRTKPYTLDLTLLASKKRVHPSAVVRERCKRRVREAVRLVVVRGARRGAAAGVDPLSSSLEEVGGSGGGGGDGVERREDDVRETGPRQWLVPGHHYIMSLTLVVYRAPLPLLLDQLRAAFRAIKRKAEAAILARQLADLEICPRALAAPGEEAVIDHHDHHDGGNNANTNRTPL